MSSSSQERELSNVESNLVADEEIANSSEKMSQFFERQKQKSFGQRRKRGRPPSMMKNKGLLSPDIMPNKRRIVIATP